MNIRVQAAKVIRDIIDGKKSFSESLPYYEKQIQNHKALYQELCYGTARCYFCLTFIATKLLKKQLTAKDNDVYALILLGIYQLLYTRIPQYAVLSETVQVARELQKLWAVNLVNAVLRNFLRRKEELLKLAEEDLTAKYMHPKWLLTRVRKEWPNNWQAVIAANNQHPLMSLRVNKSRITQKEYLEKLKTHNIEARVSKLSSSGIILKNPLSVQDIPGFVQGEVSVQDCGAQMAAELLDLREGHLVLDACAAPGGKTGHILESQAALKKVTALDCDARRLKKVEENLQRLGLDAAVSCLDITEKKHLQKLGKFDRILLDVPCSGTGVISRHSDIKLLRREEDIKKFVLKQKTLLKAAWEVLKVRGKLLYVTCSVLAAENEEVAADFLYSHKDAKEIVITGGCARKFGRQLLPRINEHDGFYYCLFEKGNF